MTMTTLYFSQQESCLWPGRKLRTVWQIEKLLKVNPQYLVQAFILVRIVDVGNENSKLFDT